MVRREATTTWEAWISIRRLIPASSIRRVLCRVYHRQPSDGGDAAVAGFAQVRVKPQPAGLTRGKIAPRHCGPVELAFSQDPARLRLEVFLPGGTSGDLLPVPGGGFSPLLNGERCSGVLSEGWAILSDVPAGWHVCEVSL